MRNALFWIITQRVVVISYRRFGTTYRVPSAAFKNPKFLNPDGGEDSLSRNISKKLPLLAA